MTPSICPIPFSVSFVVRVGASHPIPAMEKSAENLGEVLSLSL
jgi:hypothetical protein